MLYDPANSVLPTQAHLLLRAKGDKNLAHQLALSGNYDARVVRNTKAAVTAAGLDGSLVDQSQIRGFLDIQRSRSAFAAMFPSMQQIPLNTRVALLTSPPRGSTRTAAGYPVPVSSMVFTNHLVALREAKGMVVVTDELARFDGPAGAALVSQAVRNAGTDALDAEMWATIIIDGSTPVRVSSGSSTNDLAALLQSVHGAGSADAKLYWVCSPDVANLACTVTNPDGDLLFPMMSPVTGGSMVNVQSIVSSTLPAETLILVDAAGLAASVENIMFDASAYSAIEMSDSPINTVFTGLGTNLVSMIQSNCSALRVVIYYGLERLRSTAVAVCNSVTWGSEGT